MQLNLDQYVAVPAPLLNNENPFRLTILALVI